mmetsp:Transcript_15178/g.41988  ORF Transcript_15178/g.41988 Transcript_15178/m.41988 type:complete len:147 (-) Transcript_15178:246-686(-)
MLGNHRLLWHGSHIGNFTGILSQGLRIAPTEAPHHGVYFADMLGKSVPYCITAGTSEMFVLLCDVSLGRMFEAHNDVFMAEPQPEMNSTHAMSRVVPNPAMSMKLEDSSSAPSPTGGIDTMDDYKGCGFGSSRSACSSFSRQHTKL